MLVTGFFLRSTTFSEHEQKSNNKYWYPFREQVDQAAVENCRIHQGQRIQLHPANVRTAKASPNKYDEAVSVPLATTK